MRDTNNNLYYQIKGKTELRQKLADLTNDEGIFMLLTDPILWVYDKGIGSRFNLKAIELKVKLLFIANLNYLYLSEDKDSYMGMLLKAVLGIPPISIDVFDQYWTITRYRDHETSDDVLESISAEDLKIFAETGYEFADNWLQYHIERKESAESS
jgi:hypothetical protein